MQACAAGYALTYVTTLKLQLDTWTVVGLAAAKFKFILNNIYKFSSNLTGNILRLRYKVQPVKAV
jgi:hypothetical protein